MWVTIYRFGIKLHFEKCRYSVFFAYLWHKYRTIMNKRVFVTQANPIVLIDQAITKAKTEDKFVVCQVGDRTLKAIRN